MFSYLTPSTFSVSSQETLFDLPSYFRTNYRKHYLLYQKAGRTRKKGELRITKFMFRGIFFVFYRFLTKRRRFGTRQTFSWRHYLEQKLCHRFVLHETRHRVYQTRFKSPHITRYAYLRHLEVNPVNLSLILLPIPYTYFYNFLLDRTHLWKTLLIELNAAHRRHGK